MKTLFYPIAALFLSSFLVVDGQSNYKSNLTPQDSVTLYIYYKTNKTKAFYLYKNNEIVFKSKTGVDEFEYDSIKISLESSTQSNYLPISAVCRKGKKATPIEFNLQNIPGYRYIFVSQNEFVNDQYIFKPYYYNHPVPEPKRR